MASQNFGVRTLQDVKTPMRDGARLSADIYLPDAAGLFPSVLHNREHPSHIVLPVIPGG